VVRLGFGSPHADDSVAGPLSVDRQGGVCFWLHPGGLFPGESAGVATEGGAGGTSCTTPAVEAVVRDFGSPRWWRRGSLLFGGGDADMAANAAVYTPVPVCGGGFSAGPRYGIASWGGI
jgi:hypothetical protein